VTFDAFSLPTLSDSKPDKPRFSGEDADQSSKNSIPEAMHLAMAKEQDHLVVCIDENNQVVQSYGDTTKFLLQKNFNLNLAELLIRPLDIAFNKLKSATLKTNEKNSAGGIKIIEIGV